MKAHPLALAALMTLGLAGCGNQERPTGSSPAGSEVGAAMPDTSATRAPDVQMTAPDAGATGVVPPEGSPPAPSRP